MARRVRGTAGTNLQDLHVPRDPVITFMAWAAVGVVVLILSVLIFAIAAGLLQKQAPRSASEFAIAAAAANVKDTPKDGKAWYTYILSLYNAGQKGAAKDALKKARQAADKRSLVWVNNAEVTMLLADGKNAEAAKRARDYLDYNLKMRQQVMAERAGKGIKIQPQNDSELNPATIEILVLFGKASGNVKSWSDSVMAFDTALNLDPYSADILSLRGYAFLNWGGKSHVQKAIDNFKIALQLDPEYAPAKAGLKKAEVAIKTAPADPATSTPSPTTPAKKTKK